MATKAVTPQRRRTRPAAGGDPVFRLTEFFRRNGYARWKDTGRAEQDGAQRYKKGDEVRLVANSRAELTLIRQLVLEVGFRPGLPFGKGHQYRLPLYGREQVKQFLELIGELEPETRSR